MPLKMFLQVTLFGCSADGSLPAAEFVPFDVLLRESDFLVCTASLNPTTQHKFDKEAFVAMKKTAIFVNTSRGGEIACFALLSNKKLSVTSIQFYWNNAF